MLETNCFRVKNVIKKHNVLIFSCGRIRRDIEDEDFSVIVVGGYTRDPNYPFRSTVEILDESATEWRSVNSFPHPVRSTSLVTDKHGGAIVIGGFSGDAGPLDTLYRLPYSNANEWTLMDQQLTLRAGDSFSFLVSDDVCNPT